MKKGFTLVEIVVYVGVLAVVSVLVMNTLLTMTRAGAALREGREIHVSAVGALLRMTRDIRNATSVVVDSSTLGAHPGYLTLEGMDADDAPETTELYLEGGALEMKKNGVVVGPLTPASVFVERLVFNVATTSVSDAVTLELELAAALRYATTSSFFHAGAVTRGVK
jgi:hypothetical protein